MKQSTTSWPAYTISERTTEPLLKAEKPWESMCLSWFNVIRDAKGWRLWYSAYDKTYRNDNDALLCYASSADGIHWTRPNLGLVEYEGSRDNNILFDARTGGGLHGQCVFLDPKAPVAARFKMVFVREPLGHGGWLVHGAVSPDGLRWSFLPEPLLKKNSDTQQACFQDGDRYRLYVRMWSGTDTLYTGKRQVGYSESKTFGAFPDPKVILEPDAQDPVDLHFYNSAASKLRDDLYVQFPSAYHTSDHLVRPHLALSRDGQAFERIGHEPVLPFGKEGAFDSKSIYVCPGAVPGDKPNTWWIYYSGFNLGHEDKMSFSGGYGRFLLEINDTKKHTKEDDVKNTLSVSLGDPVTIVQAPANLRHWGPYQFPGLERLADGRIRVSCQIGADSATAVGLPPMQAVSADEGRTWTILPLAKGGAGSVNCTQAPLPLANGEKIQIKMLLPLKVDTSQQGPVDLLVTAEPVGKMGSYTDFTYYRLADLPPAAREGWRLFRSAKDGAAPVEEQVTMRIPGELRYVTEGVLPLPWHTGHRLLRAPDDTVWAIGEDCRLVDGTFRAKMALTILRSTDAGRSFDFWGEIPYQPDPEKDAKSAMRDGFTEPCIHFMPDGSILCFLRTTDGHGVGPMYWSRSADNGRTWRKPLVFDDLGVWPQMLTLKNGVTLLAYGRPGLYVRATRDPGGKDWGPRIEIVKAGQLMGDTCSYCALLPLTDDTALIAYSEFNVPGPDGTPRKSIRVRTIQTQKTGDQP